MLLSGRLCQTVEWQASQKLIHQLESDPPSCWWLQTCHVGETSACQRRRSEVLQGTCEGTQWSHRGLRYNCHLLFVLPSSRKRSQPQWKGSCYERAQYRLCDSQQSLLQRTTNEDLKLSRLQKINPQSRLQTIHPSQVVEWTAD